MCTRVCDPVWILFTCIYLPSEALSLSHGHLVCIAHLGRVVDLSDHKDSHSCPGDSNIWLESESSAPGVQEDKIVALEPEFSPSYLLQEPINGDRSWILKLHFISRLAVWEDSGFIFSSSVCYPKPANYLGRGYRGCQSSQSSFVPLVGLVSEIQGVMLCFF